MDAFGPLNITAESLAEEAGKVQRKLEAGIGTLRDMDEVHFGVTVMLERDDGRKQTWRIVGEDEADPAKGTISHVSPLARALYGKRVGDVVKAGQGEAEIIAIA